MDSVPIGADDHVYRRLAPDTVDPATISVRRNAFSTMEKPDPEVSAHRGHLMGTVDEVLQRAGRPHFGMARLRVGEVRELGFEVEPRPLPEDASHAVIVGIRSRTDCDRLAAACDIVKWPDAPED